MGFKFESLKKSISYLSNKRIELSLIIFIPLFLIIFAFGPAYVVQNIIFTHIKGPLPAADEQLWIKAYINIAILLSALTALFAGLILAYSILQPIRRILKSLAANPQPKAAGEIVHDNILGRDFNMMVTSLNKYMDILESMSGGVITVNSSGVVTTANPSAEMIFGCKAGELTGRTVEDIFKTTINSKDFKKIVNDSLNNKKIYSSEEINIATKDNRNITLGTTASLLKDRDGVVAGVVVNFKDLSKIKRMHNQLQRADRLVSLGGVAAGVAHEIRNPLGSIKGLAQLLSEEFKGEEKARYADTIISEVERLNVVVENLLSLAHHDRVQMRLCRIDTILNKAVELSKYYIGEKNIQIIEEYDESMPEIIGEGERLYQAFLNILMNAVQAIDKEGKIWIRATLQKDYILIDFHNSNSYIRPEVIEHIFDPFYTTKEKGTGLGLAITHQIINANKGAVSVESGNEGTHFYINLPVASQPSEVAQ